MTNQIEALKQGLRLELAQALSLVGEEKGVSLDLARFEIEIPSNTENGDFSSNCAMVYAKELKSAPRAIAEAVLQALGDNLPKYVERIEIAGPGFLNFFVSETWFADTVSGVLSDGVDYGKSDYGKGKRVLVEFVSANPTGPMHIGNARGAALGDILADSLKAAGFYAEREFYINDAGNQIHQLSMSLEARYLQIILGEDAVPFPENGYQGEYVTDYAREFYEKYGDKYLNVDEEERRKALADYVVPRNVARMKTDLASYKIEYDTWFSEQSLYESGAVERMIERFRSSGDCYEKDGALWFKTTNYGAEKDDVLVRENGFPTYYLVDIAYHYNKLVERGFDEAIDIWGADHHGHVQRVKSALTATGKDSEESLGDRLEVILIQMVRLVQAGEVVKMSKRTGKVITLTTLLEEVPIDAARFFFSSSTPTAHMDFDLDLAITQSSENPVYYVQYAHARICSIFKNLAAEGIVARAVTKEELLLLKAPEERELIRHIAVLPNEIIAVTKTNDPSKLAKFSYELAAKFHKFYNACRVKGEDEPLMQARLALCKAAQIALQNTLSIIKIDAPEVM